MRCVLQRVSRASVTVEGKIVGEIRQGILALIGIHGKDDMKSIEYMLDKIMNLRIFEDENEKMNLSVADVGGKVLLVPNFTLYGDARKGRRPSYDGGATPGQAAEIYEHIINFAANKYPGMTEHGIFQAEMKVELLNDGPVTILLDSDKLF